MARQFANRSPSNRRYAVVDVTGIGPGTIVAPVAERQQVVMSYTLVSTGICNVTWETDPGGVALSGAMPMVANQVIHASSEDAVLDSETDGQGIRLNVDAAVSVRGHATFVEE